MRIMSRSVSAERSGSGRGFILPDRGAGGTPLFPPDRSLTLAQFVQRYPPALGGSEVYVERLSRYLAGHGDAVQVWTTTAVGLEEMWRPGKNPSPDPSPKRGGEQADGDRKSVV